MFGQLPTTPIRLAGVNVIDNFVFHKFIESNRIQKYKAFPGDANVRKSLPFAGILCGQADGSDGSSSANHNARVKEPTVS